MKAITKNQKKYFYKIMIVSIILVTSSLNSLAQKTIKAIEVSSDVTGSGLGGNIFAGMSLTHGNSSWGFGANFQRQKFNFSGMQLNYRHTAWCNENKNVELFFYGNLLIHTSAFLSQKSVKMEEAYRPEEECNYNKLSFKVIEAYAGFGTKFNHTKRLSTVCNLGFGGFETLNKNYNIKMHREKSGLGLQLRFALLFNFL
jgi:hypothetical protein